MWKVTLCLNVMVLTLFWILCQVAITPAHNLLVIYSETISELPILTDVAIQSRSGTVFIPFVWAILTIILGRQLRSLTEAKRNEWISLHLSVSLSLGLVMLCFFTLAGLLPVLKIGASIG